MRIQELGRVKQIIEEACHLDITHFYEDIVLVEHSPFLVRFDADDMRFFHLYFNKDCSQENRVILFERLKKASEANEMRCADSGSFSLEQVKGKEEISIQFYEKAGT